MKDMPSTAAVTTRPEARRIAAVPAVVGCMYWQMLHGGAAMRWVALVIFIAAGVTDILDGYVARAWSQQSTLGRMLDPIADKLLVSSCLLMLAADRTIQGASLFAAIDRAHVKPETAIAGAREIAFFPPMTGG